MESRDYYKEKIESQLARWKTTLDGLKQKIEQGEADAKAKLQEQWSTLSDKRAKAEQLLEGLSAASQETWEQVKSQVEHGWTELTSTAQKTMAKIREGIAAPNHDEDIRQIAYQLWLDEGCPQGRHVDHWIKAESIWRERQAAKPAARTRAVKAPAKKRSTAAASRPRKAKPRRPPSPNPKES